MTEIKSTLDLVLEKTKNLTLSSKEKQQQRQKEIKNRLKGMLQKYQDGLLTLEELKNEYEKLQQEDRPATRRTLIEVIISRIDLLQDNGSLLQVLDKMGGCSISGLESVIDESHFAYEDAARKRSKQLKNRLAAEHAISGSAVVPRLESDERWRQKAQQIRDKFQDKLAQQKEKLSG
jgi:hypothetical protein